MQSIVPTHLGATGGTHPLERLVRDVFQFVELGADHIGHGPWNADHVHIAGVSIGRDPPFDDVQQGCSWFTLVVMGAGKRLEVEAHHALAEAGAFPELALGWKTHAGVGGAIGQP